MAYEQEQAGLQKLWDELLSDESDFSPDISDYEPSAESSTSDSSARSLGTCKKSKIRKKSSAREGKLTKQNGILSEMDQNIEQVARSTKDLPSTSKGNGTDIHCIQDIDQIIEDVIAQNAYNNSTDSEDGHVNDQPSEVISWTPVTGSFRRQFNWSEVNPGISADLYDKYDKTPYDFFKMIVTDDIIEMFVTETNRYAAQEKEKNNFRKSRIRDWKDTGKEEMEKFIGIIFWMGVISLPSISSYWSKCFLYQNNIRDVFSRNRFQMLLKHWHFANNAEQHDENDRLYKISPLLDKLRESFQSKIVPGEYICIDETLVPFKGKLKFKQYISNKRHKFGIKLFKLCLQGGYLYELKVYCGQEKDNQEKSETVPTKVVINLANKLLGKGRTLCTDNYYTSVELAHKLIGRETYLLGTLRSNRKNNLKNVILKKLKKGECIAEESNTGIFVEKWKDKRDVMMLNTKFVPEMITIHKRLGVTQKPKSVIEYNKYKSYIDISDQMKAYNTSLRRGVKWYRKLAIELVTGAALVNAYWLYQNITNNKISITTFREQVIAGLIGKELPLQNNPLDQNHTLKEMEKKANLLWMLP